MSYVALLGFLGVGLCQYQMLAGSTSLDLHLVCGCWLVWVTVLGWIPHRHCVSAIRPQFIFIPLITTDQQ